MKYLFSFFLLLLTTQAFANSSWKTAEKNAIFAFLQDDAVAAATADLRDKMIEPVYLGDSHTLILNRICTPACRYSVLVRRFLSSPQDGSRLRSVSAIVTLLVSSGTDRDGLHRTFFEGVDRIRTDLDF